MHTDFQTFQTTNEAVSVEQTDGFATKAFPADGFQPGFDSAPAGAAEVDATFFDETGDFQALDASETGTKTFETPEMFEAPETFEAPEVSESFDTFESFESFESPQ